MASYPLFWLPLAGLAVLAVSGAGLAITLGRRFPADAQAALAAPVSAAVLVCASPLLKLGLPTPLIGGVVVVALGVATIAVRRRVASSVRAALVPLVVAGVALFCATAPLIPHGASGAVSLGNADPYLWVSEAKAFLDGPPPVPSSEFPDRRAYEYSDELHWTLGLPFALAQVAALGRLDPEQAYGSFAAIIAALLALAVYGSARACLGWTPKVSAVASALVSANALLLYSTLNGWQAQLGLTAFGLLSIFCLRLALDDEALPRERLLTGLFIAAAISVYGSLFGWFAVLLGVTLAGYAFSTRPARIRRAAVVAGGVALAAAAIGFASIIESIQQVRIAAAAAGSSRWDNYQHGLPAEAIGLIPRIGTADRPSVSWSVLALAVTAALVFLALRRGPPLMERRRDVLVWTSLFSLGAIILLQLPGPNPYLSLKTAAYAAPLLTMFAVNGLVRRPLPPRARLAIVSAAAALFVGATLVVVLQPLLHLRSSRSYASVRAAASELPSNSRIAVGVTDTWGQLWLVYFLRDRPVVVLEPGEYLQGFGQTTALEAPTRSYQYLIEQGRSRDAIWEGDAFAALPSGAGRLRKNGLAWVHLRRVNGSSRAGSEFVHAPADALGKSASVGR